MTSATSRTAGGRTAARTHLSVVAALVTVLVAVLALDLHAVRVTAAVLGCLVLPGLGWARRLRLRDAGDTLALTVVLSVSSTAVVATAMALAGRWSPLGGLIALSGITVLGFVPVRALGARAGVFLFGRPLLADGFEEQWAAASRAADEEWSDWYAEVRRQVDEERLRQEAEAEAAEREWRDWYADVRRREEEDRRRHEAEREAAEQEWPHWNAESHPDAVGSEPDRPRTDFAAGLP